LFPVSSASKVDHPVEALFVRELVKYGVVFNDPLLDVPGAGELPISSGFAAFVEEGFSKDLKPP